jgi:hypothetical protein
MDALSRRVKELRDADGADDAAAVQDERALGRLGRELLGHLAERVLRSD